MCKEDLVQVSEIDREAFPEQLPPPNYERELRNGLAHYIVVCDEEETIDEPEVKAPSRLGAWLARLASGWRRLFGNHNSSSYESPAPDRHYIAGFVGLWIMADEAHITSIAVREAYRRRGIGELLLISGISLATELKARIVTLEVRASNGDAQNLYVKYGFTRVGVRRGYYMDSREDGVLMSTGDITLAPFQARLRHLSQVHSDKWGMTFNQAGRQLQA